MDKLFINQLKVTTLIGVHAWEQLSPQNICLDLILQVDAAQAAKEDTIENVLDYDQLVKHIIYFAQKYHFQLIETFVERLAQEILEHFPTPYVQLTLHKPGALLQANGVAITIERHRGTSASYA